MHSPCSAMGTKGGFTLGGGLSMLGARDARTTADGTDQTADRWDHLEFASDE